MRAILIAAALLTGVAPAATAAAQSVAPSTAPARDAQFERDRQSILAQAGQYRVRFDMRENAVFRAGYEALDEKLSGGNEIVRIVYDHGDRISLQHILVMEHDGKSMVIKHWRQDWVYQPTQVLTYAGPDEWTLTSVSDADRTGAWSQTVWQTDDSPRYGGVGRWNYDNGMAEWTSNVTWRPLARRDAVRNPVYDRYLGSNRHALTPAGWVHIQDNLKMAPAQGDGGEPTAVVHEDVTNTYSRWDGYSAKPGDDYWAATKDYWAAIRDAWDAAIARGNGVHVEEEADTGVVTGMPLMDLAQKIQDGEITQDAAIAQGRRIIEDATKR
ncbi:DUF6607 family protein [Brevundimonas faecalis]